MLAYIAIALGICNLALGLAFGLIRVHLQNRIKSNVVIRENFRNAARWLVGGTGLFAIPVIEYLLSDIHNFPKNVLSVAALWGASCAVAFLILIARLTTLVRSAKF
jgi:hypothetical protein